MLMRSGWLKLVDQKPTHFALGLTLAHIFTLIALLFFTPPPTPGLWGIKAHFIRVSGGWYRERCHYTPHVISRTLNQVLQGVVMYRVCRFTAHALHHPKKPAPLRVHEVLAWTFYFFFLSNGSRISKLWPKKGTYTTILMQICRDDNTAASLWRGLFWLLI